MKHTLKYYLGVAAVFVKMSIQSHLEYPISLLGWVLVNPIQFIVGFATIRFVVQQFGTLGGWGYEGLAFLYGLAVLSHGLAVILFIQTWYMGKWVVRGEFDRFLLRPMNVLFQFLFSEFNLVGISDLIPGFMVFIYGCVQVRFHCSLLNLCLLVMTLIGGVLIRGAVWMMCGSMAFWTNSPTNFVGFTLELFDRVTMYPLNIYPKALQFVFTFILPLGWITFYPASELLKKTPDFIPVNMAVVTFLVGAVWFGLACFMMHRGMRRYESAGS